MKKMIFSSVLLASALFAANHEGVIDSGFDPKSGEYISIEMNMLDNNGDKKAGEVIVINTPYGVAFFPNLKGLQTPGLHGFHIHQNPDCGATEKGLGTKAGGHWNPLEAKKHSFPWSDDGHKGDLPALYVDANGNANYPVLAPKIKDIKELKGHSLMIHVGGDNHSDNPNKLGGGGARMLCGVIK